jgi:hypothetical protein
LAEDRGADFAAAFQRGDQQEIQRLNADLTRWFAPAGRGGAQPRATTEDPPAPSTQPLVREPEAREPEGTQPEVREPEGTQPENTQPETRAPEAAGPAGRGVFARLFAVRYSRSSFRAGGSRRPTPPRPARCPRGRRSTAV